MFSPNIFIIVKSHIAIANVANDLSICSASGKCCFSGEHNPSVSIISIQLQFLNFSSFLSRNINLNVKPFVHLPTDVENLHPNNAFNNVDFPELCVPITLKINIFNSSFVSYSFCYISLIYLKISSNQSSFYVKLSPFKNSTLYP